MTLSWFINKTAENCRFLAVFPRRRKEKHAAPFSLLTVSGSRVDVTPPDPHYQTLSWFWQRRAQMTLIQIREMEMPTSFLMYSNPQNLRLWWKAAECARGGRGSAVGSLHEKQSLISWVAHTHTNTHKLLKCALHSCQWLCNSWCASLCVRVRKVYIVQSVHGPWKRPVTLERPQSCWCPSEWQL